VERFIQSDKEVDKTVGIIERGLMRGGKKKYLITIA
jgi:hypothetical protein